MTLWMKMMIRIRITGEMSMPPRLGMIERIGRKQRLGDPPQEFADHRHELVARIHDVERDQPGQDRRGDQQPDVELQGDQDDVEKRAHRADRSAESNAGSGPRCDAALRVVHDKRARAAPARSLR